MTTLLTTVHIATPSSLRAACLRRRHPTMGMLPIPLAVLPWGSSRVVLPLQIIPRMPLRTVNHPTIRDPLTLLVTIATLLPTPPNQVLPTTTTVPRTPPIHLEALPCPLPLATDPTSLPTPPERLTLTTVDRTSIEAAPSHHRITLWAIITIPTRRIIPRLRTLRICMERSPRVTRRLAKVLENHDLNSIHRSLTRRRNRMIGVSMKL